MLVNQMFHIAIISANVEAPRPSELQYQPAEGVLDTDLYRQLGG
jgi:hypothetical protein